MIVEPLDAPFGAVVTGVRLDALDQAAWQQLHAAWLEHALLVLPGQFPTRDVQNAFALRFGELEFPASPIANIDRHGAVHSSGEDDVVRNLRGNEGWHHDSTYLPVQAKGAVLSAEIVPSTGGATEWADMRAAYDALPDGERERLSGLRARHSIAYSQRRAGYLPSRRSDGTYNGYGYHDLEAPLRPLVKVHPDTGRPNLLIGRHAHDIEGWEPAESERFLDELNEWACAEERRYRHQWAVGDAVVWDNRRLMHRATPFDMTEPRRMWHTRIAGDPATETADNHRVVGAPGA
ncbi:MAG TPA: TauD/TfdA family dioxygenase [Acidimicrobiales bacterium]|nr:TauD/TfdA family dioxygenase [Acidimicrobiales bacterium]